MEHAFPCGNTSLDFVGTLRARRNQEPTEMLGSADSLDAWFRESGVSDTAPGASTADLDAALTLREAIYTLVAGRIAGDDYQDDALSIINEAAALPSPVTHLDHHGKHTQATPAQALSAVARDAIDILSRPASDVLKECGRPECTQVYLDLSRGSRREWCAMETCGNKMKAAAYRARKRAA